MVLANAWFTNFTKKTIIKSEYGKEDKTYIIKTNALIGNSKYVKCSFTRIMCMFVCELHFQDSFSSHVCTSIVIT